MPFPFCRKLNILCYLNDALRSKRNLIFNYPDHQIICKEQKSTLKYHNMLRASSNLLTGLFAKGGGSRSGGGARVVNHRYSPSESARFHYESRIPHLRNLEKMAQMTEKMDGRTRRKEVMAHNKRLLYRSSVAKETKTLQRQQQSERQSRASHDKHFPLSSSGGGSQAAATNLRRLR